MALGQAMGLNLGDYGGICGGVCCIGWVVIWALGWMEWGHTVLQSFFLIVLFYFSLTLVVYLLGEVDVTIPILLIFSFAPYLPLVSLTFLWT